MTTVDTKELDEKVQRMYRAVATEPHGDYHFELGRALAERLGYPADALDALPAAAIESFAGVGYFFDLAALQPAETVVDLGSGSGMDSFVAARQVGADGRVIGIDMTDAQVEKATRLAAAHGIGNVELRKAYIEELPLDSHSADVVISNGVINLSAANDRVFAEAARVLRPGGRLAIADIVTATQLPEGVTCDAALWAACIGGAMQRDDYREAIGAAGFDQAKFRAGRIETPPVEDESADCVISNGVINLSPEKDKVFAEAARLLRPGGRLAIADIVSEQQLKESIVCDADLWASCIGGAAQEDSYRQAIEAAGLRVEDIRRNPYEFISQRARNASVKYGVKSVSLVARKEG